MRNDHYPPGTVDNLLHSELINDITKDVLEKRIRDNSGTPKFFDPQDFLVLGAVCSRLIPQPPGNKFIDLAIRVDHQLHKQIGNGWRYNNMPADDQAFKTGIKNINKAALSSFQNEFHLLENEKQDKVLLMVQSGKINTDEWNNVPSILFFEELLSMVVELYYGHPYAKDQVGDVSMSDAMGWQQLGLNQLEPREPLPIKLSPDAGQ